MTNILYDEVVDAAYIKYTDAEINHSVEISETITADYDSNDAIRGIEVLDVSIVLGEKNVRTITQRREEKISWVLLKEFAERKCTQGV